MTEKSKRVDYEMKYIGWNVGDIRIERHETKGDIEILELKIDGVDVLKQLEKLEDIKKEVESSLKESKEYLDTYDKPEPHNVEMSRYWLEKGFYGTALELKKILEAEG